VAAGADKEKSRFVPGAASTYKGSQTLDKITIAAVPFLSDEDTARAFDKVNPNKYGVLPVLLIIENGTGKALRLNLKAELVNASNEHLEATPADDVPYVGGPRKVPKLGSVGSPIPLPKRNKGGPLNKPEITGQGFAAKLIPVGESASGFVYYQSPFEPGARLYITGIADANTGKEYFYFEVPVERQ
jgi:hypothetical protein